MRIEELVKILGNERSTVKYLFEKKISRDAVHCPFCNYTKFYLMGRKRIRCRRCRKDHDFLKPTWFGRLRISYAKWLLLIKLFEVGTSARTASSQAGIGYPAALKSYDIMRISILHQLARQKRILRGQIEADEAYFGGRRKGNRGRGARNKTIVFGILERGGRVYVSVVPNVSADTLSDQTVRKVRRGSIVYTDRWHGYDSLMFCGYKHLSVDHKYKFKSGKVYINGIEGFWSFAKERLIKHHGISPHKFLLYIKEMEWRYNNRKNNLFDLLIDYMLGAVKL
ncbi:MAG: IS1595 family transposase [Thaumarchaeota archaeon]|nr:IS1595 family transposase [Nitrososphaerota archaeon]